MQIKDLRPNLENPRTISKEKLNQLKRALLEFGDLSGIVYNRKTKQLCGGHQRLKHLDPDAPITIIKKYFKPTKTGTVAEGFVELKGDRFTYREVYWDEYKEKAANLAANKGAGEWDLPKVGEWFKNIGDNFDLKLTMFDPDEILKIGGITVSEHTRTGPTGIDEDEVPEKAPAKTKLGDLYQLGSHRLLCGDSTNVGMVEKLMDGKKADMIFTDPPYGMDLDTDYSKQINKDGVAGNKHRKVIGDDKEFDPSFLLTFFSYCEEILLWGYDYYASRLPAGIPLVWDKRVEEKYDAVIGSAFELLWSKKKRKREIIRFNYTQWGNRMADNVNGKKPHPTMKPVAMLNLILEKIKGDLVVDLFGGSGSTLIACEKTNRKCFMMEIDPHYCDIIVQRWEKYTGNKSILLNKKSKVKIRKQTKNLQA